MSLFDRLARRRSGQSERTAPADAVGAHALDRYERMLASAPPAAVEGVHAEAFARLSPEQRDAVFEQLTAAASADERPADASAAALARSVSRAESRRPGTLARLLGTDPAGTDPTGTALDAAVGTAILGTVAAYAASSALWDAWAAEGDEEPPTYGSGIGDFNF